MLRIKALNNNHLRMIIKVAPVDADLNYIDISDVSNMSYLFSSLRFNGDISKWDVSNVKDMSNMFNFSNFNQDISMWNISKVVNYKALIANSKISNSHYCREENS